jgi:hypothetical protein
MSGSDTPQPPHPKDGQRGLRSSRLNLHEHGKRELSVVSGPATNLPSGSQLGCRMREIAGRVPRAWGVTALRRMPDRSIGRSFHHFVSVA